MSSPLEPSRPSPSLALILVVGLVGACAAPPEREVAPPPPPSVGGSQGDGAAEASVFQYRVLSPLDPASLVEQPVFRQDLGRSGYVMGAQVPEHLTLAWELTGLNPGMHTAAKGSPSVVKTPDGPRLLVGGDSGQLHCLTPEGELLWSARTRPSGFGIHGTPAVERGLVYIGAYDGALYAFDLETGEGVFRTQLGGSIGSSPVLHDGKVYVSVETPVPSGILSIVDARSGELLWQDDALRDHPHSSVALDPTRNVMVVGDNSGDLTVWDLDPPRRRTVFHTGDAIKGPILLHEGIAFFGSWDHHLYAVDVTSGELRWQVEAGNRCMGGAALSPEDGLVYMGCHDGFLRAIEVDSGQVAWTFEAGVRILSSPTVAAGRVLFGSHAGKLHILESASGHLLYEFQARGAVTSAPALMGDRVVFAERAPAPDLPGSLYVLAPP